MGMAGKPRQADHDLSGDFQCGSRPPRTWPHCTLSVPSGSIAACPSGRVVNGYHVPLIEFTLSLP